MPAPLSPDLRRRLHEAALTQSAAAVAERFRLETASGDWMDSRDLARQAIAMLDSGAFSRTQFAAR